ncbi:MAG: two-component system cell cycle sensor histidine kinase/response regulator CckA, partial [Myxococcota bacterium]
MASDSTTDEIALRAEIEALRRKVASLEATASDRGAQLIRFEMLVRHAPICIHEIDLDGKLTSMNPAGLEMMNAHEEAEVRGLRYLDVVAQPDRERVGALLSKAFGGSASSFDFRAGPEDARVQLASCFIPLSDPTGKVNRLMGVSEDVTQRRHHVEELAQRNEELVRWAHIFEYARVPMIVSEAEPFIRMANPAAAELYGYTTEQMRGMPIAALLRDDDVTAVRGMADATDGDGVFHLDAIHVRGDGSEFPVGGTLTAVHGDDDTVVYRVAVLRDLTEEKATEASRVRLLQQFQQAQKLESLGLLAGGIAHDFNNMLVGILVNTGLAQMAAPTGGDLARLLAE